MSRNSEREVARLLASRTAPRPPADLVARIKDEIPQDVRLDPGALARMGVYRSGAHRRVYRQFVLLAATLFVVVGMGLWGMRVLREQEKAAVHSQAIDDLLRPAGDDARKSEAEHSPAPAARQAPAPPHDVPAVPPAAASRSHAAVPGTAADQARLVPDRSAGRAAQEAPRASLLVKVRDPHGLGLPGATVEVVRGGEGDDRRVGVTDVRGEAVFPALTPGAYSVVGELSGFETRRVDGVDVSADATRDLPLELQPAPFEEAITVAAETMVVDPRSATTSPGQATPAQPPLLDPHATLRRSYKAVIGSTPRPANDWGRGTASLTVTVCDGNGGALPGAWVVLRRVDPPSLAARDAAGNAEGRARFLDLPAGGYRVNVELPGFEPRSLGTVRVEEGRQEAISVGLEVATGTRTPTPLH